MDGALNRSVQRFLRRHIFRHNVHIKNKLFARNWLEPDIQKLRFSRNQNTVTSLPPSCSDHPNDFFRCRPLQLNQLIRKVDIRVDVAMHIDFDHFKFRQTCRYPERLAPQAFRMAGHIQADCNPIFRKQTIFRDRVYRNNCRHRFRCFNRRDNQIIGINVCYTVPRQAKAGGNPSIPIHPPQI